ncbi:decaprenyl-phosphate phosphoribosyltransferase [Candidatus Peregrinibacteria bacterium]|jgi:4-hydroxybenzoate polyprenyltransferase|nr:decaprenyl-phosphate phosphoribosyltransferase [Candidatus Peregrinibacteria bacterium]MBT7702605.1 decaprenyl-phosphate phosphoribosyltransferase [Candidatus Peregrinibacteria bacterium]
MLSYLKLLRPHHWIKNFFIFVPIFFAKEIFVWEKLENTLLAFVVFCLAASAVYVVNDIVDRDQDAKHPVKKKRPIASGKVSIGTAILMVISLLIMAAIIVWQWIPAISYVVLIYLGLNLVYSFYLKHQAIFDVLLISALYLVRIIGGGFATNTPISSWLILCTLFVTLFMILGKRKAELMHKKKRKVLSAYNPIVLDHLLTITVALTLISYSLYSVLAINSSYAVFSIFFVLLAMFRYLHLTYSEKGEAENPEKIILKDQVILGSILSWGIFMFIIFYY